MASGAWSGWGRWHCAARKAIEALLAQASRLRGETSAVAVLARRAQRARSCRREARGTHAPFSGAAVGGRASPSLTIVIYRADAVVSGRLGQSEARLGGSAHAEGPGGTVARGHRLSCRGAVLTGRAKRASRV